MRLPQRGFERAQPERDRRELLVRRLEHAVVRLDLRADVGRRRALDDDLGKGIRRGGDLLAFFPLTVRAISGVVRAAPAPVAVPTVPTLT